MSAIIAWSWPFILTAGVAAVGLWRAWTTGKQSGVNQERANNAEAREKNLDRIKRADAARPSVGVQNDPYNRDG